MTFDIGQMRHEVLERQRSAEEAMAGVTRAEGVTDEQWRGAVQKVLLKAFDMAGGVEAMPELALFELREAE